MNTPPKTAREIIDDIQANVEKLTPEQNSIYAVQLAIYLGNFGDVLARKSVAYAKKFSAIRENAKSDRQAEMLCKAEPEYLEKKRWENAVESVRELIMALKKRCQVQADENRGNY